MNVTYKNNKLKKYAEDEKYSIQKLGPRRSELYLKRIGDLIASETLEDTRNLPGNFHELRQNRKGQWACDLDHPYRLIIQPHEDPIPLDENGKYIWIEIKGVEILEITNYHGK